METKPVGTCQHCCGTGEVDTGGFTPWGASISDACPYCNGTGADARCQSCDGLGTPAGEAAGLICGTCMGSGIQPTEEPD